MRKTASCTSHGYLHASLTNKERYYLLNDNVGLTKGLPAIGSDVGDPTTRGLASALGLQLLIPGLLFNSTLIATLLLVLSANTVLYDWLGLISLVHPHRFWVIRALRVADITSH